MSEDEFRNVFDGVKELVATSTLPEGSWYIIAAATLLTADGSSHFGQLYTQALAEAGGSTGSAAAKKLSTTFREIIIKAWTLVGMPRAISASYSLQRVAEPEEARTSSTNNPTPTRREVLLEDPGAALSLAQTWFSRAFAHEEARIWNGFSNHKDMEWTLKQIVYGIFLAELSILDPVQNELVVLACVMGQASGSPTRTHMAALKRIGASDSDVDIVTRAVKMVAEALGKDTASWGV